MTEFLLHYGLIAIFLCAAFEPDISFFFTGVAIHIGTVSTVPAVALMILGALLHDTLWFMTGRHRAGFVRESGIYRRIGPAVERLANRVGPSQLFLCRFVWGTRNASLLYWGVHLLPWRRYFAIQLASLLIWGSVLATLGYKLSNHAEEFVGGVERAERWLFGALLTAAFVFFAIRRVARWLVARRAARLADFPTEPATGSST
jgi:membrane protein DedA with SNARE-associated domain